MAVNNLAVWLKIKIGIAADLMWYAKTYLVSITAGQIDIPALLK
jgi:hypothetical protein